MSNDERNKLIEHFRESNEKLFMTYLENYDPSYFIDPEK